MPKKNGTPQWVHLDPQDLKATGGAKLEKQPDGSILVSKDLVGRLSITDAEAVGLDVGSIDFTPLGEVTGASEKATRDAGAIPVTTI